MLREIQKIGSEVFFEKGHWGYAALVGIAIPSLPVSIEFDGQQILLRPGRVATSDLAPIHHMIALKQPNGTALSQAHQHICNFANSLSWIKETPIEIKEFSGGDLPRQQGYIGETSIEFNNDFFIEYLPEPSNHSAKLALAIYREGQLLNIPAYQCLSYFRILNLAHGSGGHLKQWIREHFEDVRKYWPNRLHDWEPMPTKKTESTIEQYFIVSNRCAVAHASAKEPTIDPNDLDDLQRMQNDLPFVKAMAAYTIEHTFGIPSAQTAFRMRR